MGDSDDDMQEDLEKQRAELEKQKKARDDELERLRLQQLRRSRFGSPSLIDGSDDTSSLG